MIDLVAGYAKGYNEIEIRPFLKSLRQTGYGGKILLFANGGAAKEAEKWDVNLRPVPKPKIKVHSDRFIVLEQALEDIEFEGVLLSDTRDVIFQKNPTHLLPSKGLNVYEEDGCMSLQTCPYNSMWLELGYGDKTLIELSNTLISCVGTSCGDKKTMMNYLHRLVEEVKRIQPRTSKPQDQAAHNYLIRKELDCRVWNNEEGEIYTIGYVQRGQVKIKKNKVVNMYGEIPAVIHQWDRHKNIENLMKIII